MKTTDTPRTDAFREGDSLLESWEEEWEEAITFARQLERELTASKAEVERLKGEWQATEEALQQMTRDAIKARQ